MNVMYLCRGAPTVRREDTTGPPSDSPPISLGGRTPRGEVKATRALSIPNPVTTRVFKLTAGLLQGPAYDLQKVDGRGARVSWQFAVSLTGLCLPRSLFQRRTTEAMSGCGKNWLRGVRRRETIGQPRADETRAMERGSEKCADSQHRRMRGVKGKGAIPAHSESLSNARDAIRRAWRRQNMFVLCVLCT